MDKFNKSIIMKSVLLTSAILGGSYFFAGDNAKANTVDSTKIAANVTNKTNYNDFDSTQYWADEMQWMIDNGYITGYINQKHPATGKHGNWLNPGGKLTEAQMLSILLRYELGIDGYERMKETIPNIQGKPSHNHYVQAEIMGIMTKGSTYYSSFTPDYANQQVTRGQLALALVSMFYGHDITLEEAVQFMFDNNITSGTDPKKGPTVENFAPNTNLSRAHISTFLKRFDEAVTSGNIKYIDFKGRYENIIPSNTNGKDPNIFTLVSKTEKTDDVVGNKIKTKFGERSYGVSTQAEYDQLMKIIERDYGNLDDFPRVNVSGSRVQYEQALEDYLFHGKTGITDKSNPNYRTGYNLALISVEKSFSSFKGKLKTMDEAIYLLDLREFLLFGSNVYEKENATYDVSHTAYNLVVEGNKGYKDGPYTMSAILDQLGIDSFVFDSMMDVQLAVKLYGDWYVFDNSGCTKLTPEVLNKEHSILYAPNGGLYSLPPFLQKKYKPVN